MHCLVEVTPLDPVTVIEPITIGGSPVTIGGVEVTLPRPWSLSRPTLRLSSVQDRTVNGLNGVTWWPGIVRKPVLAMKLFDGDFSSDIQPGQATIDLSVNALEKMDANARRFIWAGANITIHAGATGQAWPWTTVFSGRVDSFKAQGNRLTLTATVDEEPFATDVLSLSYAGTGGLEGGADIKGKPKPWALGAPRNIEPVLIDSVNSVFQVSAYSTIKAVDALYERGADFGASYGDYASYTALVAANIPPGRWATCFASGLIRLGAPPYGVITADVQGDYLSSTWVRLPGDIIGRVCSQLGISSSLLNTASLDALDSYAGTLPAGGNISLYLTEQTDVLSLAKRIARTFNAQAGVSWTGKLFTTRLAIGTPSTTLDAQQTRLPRVIESVETDVSPPYAKMQMGGERAWRVHSFDEIAFQAELVDKGDYSASETYREGNIVFQPSDGVRYVYINPTATSGNAPPDVSYWSAMQSQDPAVATAVANASDAQTTASAAQATASAAQTVADAAQDAADAAQADATVALDTLTNIASDSVLSPDEKPRVIQDRDVIVAEQSGIDAQATAYSISTEKTAYDAAVGALTSYLASLTSPVAWDNLSGNTAIVGATFRQRFKDVYDARQTLLNKIAAEAGERADWLQITSIPYDEIISNADDVALGFNPAFVAWTGTYPDGWSGWSGTAPTKETTLVRVGSFAAKFTGVTAAANRGMQANYYFDAPLPAGTFVSGTVDMYMPVITTGLPGIKVRLYTNAGHTTFTDTDVRPVSTAATWQRVPWTARVATGQVIYGIRIYVMASYTSFAGGGFTGDVIFDHIRFALFDATTDNTAVAIAADGSLSGAGGGQVTITGLGYNGDLDATHGADWATNVTNIPYDEVLNNDDSTTLGFNGSFEAWAGTYPNGWAIWTTGTGISKEASIVRFGSNAVRIAASGSDVGLQLAASWTGSPMPVATVLSGNIDFYLVSRTSGLPGILVRLFTNAALTTYVDTKVQPASTGTGSWQTIPWVARVGAAQQIYGLRIYLMGSWGGFASGAFTGTAILDRLNFAFFNGALDNSQITIAANGALAGGGGGQVTISGLGYTGALDATKGAPSGTNVGGTSATTVETGANAANNGVNSDGTIKTDKVGTGSIALNSVTAPGQVALVSPFDVSTKNAWVDVLTQTLTVSGQPGQLSCYWDAVAVDPGTAGFSFGFFYMRLLRDAVVMKQWLSSGTFIDSASNANDVAVCEVEKFISLLDTPSAGSRTYKLQAYLVSGSGEWPSDSYLRALPGTNILLVDLKR